jgi:hypothetical protein
MPVEDTKMKDIIDSDLSLHLIPSENDELDEIMRGLLEIRQRYNNKTIDPAIILEHIDHLYQFRDVFDRGTSDPDNFFTLADIEALYQNYRSRISEVDFNNLLQYMSKIKGEAALIKKKRKNTSKKA